MAELQEVVGSRTDDQSDERPTDHLMVLQPVGDLGLETAHEHVTPPPACPCNDPRAQAGRSATKCAFSIVSSYYADY